jgi:hypothetical protein
MAWLAIFVTRKTMALGKTAPQLSQTVGRTRGESNDGFNNLIAHQSFGGI